MDFRDLAKVPHKHFYSKHLVISGAGLAYGFARIRSVPCPGRLRADLKGWLFKRERGSEVERAARVLEAWAAADPGTPDEGLTAKQEIKAIQDAMTQKDWEFFTRYGGRGPAMKRAAALINMPEAKVTEGVSIDDYSTWRAVGFADRDEGG